MADILPDTAGIPRPETILMALQDPNGSLKSPQMTSVTDPINSRVRAADRMAHFFEGIYDTSAESHLTRFVKTLLGDAGAGGIGKMYTVARLQSVLTTMRYHDLDMFYGTVFGIKRLADEMLGMSPYTDTASDAEWEEIEARDASYRSRIEAFSRAIALGPTVAGMEGVGFAVTGVECRVIENYVTLDEGAVMAPPTAPVARIYETVERDFESYGLLDNYSYSNIESGKGVFGDYGDVNRTRFTIIPKEHISLERIRMLSIVLNRLKPLGSMVVISPEGAISHRGVPVRQAYADSVYWQVTAKKAPSKIEAKYTNAPVGQFTPAKRPVFSAYQGEAWAYNSEVTKVTSYVLQDRRVVASSNYQRITTTLPGTKSPVTLSYAPEEAILPTSKIIQGRAASDAISLTDAFGREGVI